MKDFQKNETHQLLNENKLDDAFKVNIKNLSLHQGALYKIFPPELSRIEALYEDKIWFSDPNYFDDPFDTGHWVSSSLTYESAIKKLTAEQRSQITHPEALKETISHGTSMLRNDFRKPYLVSCFIEQIDSTVLWSQYGRSNEGFAIQIDTTPLSLIELDYSIWPVKYVSTPIELSGLLSTPETFQYRLLLAKGDEWSYQNEWRAITKQSELENNRGKLLLTPRVTALYLGINAKPETRNAINRLANEKDVWLYEMTTSVRRNQLVAKPIRRPHK